MRIYFIENIFSRITKIGVAIYANSVENLEKIHKKVGYYPDFIHVDFVDSSMRKEVEDVKLYKLETMKAYCLELRYKHILCQ